VVIPTNDYTTAALAHHPESLDGLARAVLPPAASSALAQDKYKLGALAESLQIATPPTRLARSRDALAAAAESVGFPCAVKYRRGSGAAGLHRLRHAGSLARLPEDARGSDLAFETSEYVIQRWVPGLTRDVCGLFHHGEPRALVVQQRTRTYPAVGGAGIDCVTIEAPTLVEQAVRLMRELRWHGPAQIEFKHDPATGRTWLIEVNGRLWGTLALANWAGVDIPWLICRMALDGDVEANLDYRTGARYRWAFPLGVLHAFQTPHPLRTLSALLWPDRGADGDWHWSDPGPHAAEVVYILQRQWGRGRFGPGRPPVEVES
jgi:predicted ATP-grasp superfamily ATP-dependent carboligase